MVIWPLLSMIFNKILISVRSVKIFYANWKACIQQVSLVLLFIMSSAAVELNLVI